jgi:hypothetical protein
VEKPTMIAIISELVAAAGAAFAFFVIIRNLPLP